MKLFKPVKPAKPEANIPFAIYLSTFNTQSAGVLEATRAWAAEKLMPNIQQPHPR